MGRQTGGRFKREAIYVHLWLIHVEVWQKTTTFCKAIILQLKNKYFKRIQFVLMAGFSLAFPYILCPRWLSYWPRPTPDSLLIKLNLWTLKFAFHMIFTCHKILFLWFPFLNHWNMKKLFSACGTCRKTGGMPDWAPACGMLCCFRGSFKIHVLNNVTKF